MKEQEFKSWLLIKFKKTVAQSRFSNCVRVENHLGDLDLHFDKDKCLSLMESLVYSTIDQRNNTPPSHTIPINGNIRTGSATLKQAVSLYLDYRNGVEPATISTNYNKDVVINKRVKKPKQEWPEWDKPTNDDLYELIKLNARFAKFLHPDIIKALVEDNNKNWAVWRANLKLHNINPNIYLWHKSPCAFPGVRRYSGSKEIAYFRKHTALEDNNIPDALQLDDNDYPKHLWSFVFRGRPFPKHGPKGYALAHLADHKNYSNRMYDEFDVINPEDSTPLYGLYTAPTNTVFLPTSLIRPSDFSPIVRKILIEKANDLYGSFCNVLPPNIQFKEDKTSKWYFSNFDWSEPVGDLKNMELFFDYRIKKMTGFLRN
ncbi:hypothetical protein [Winogradskyella sp. UBA3174]|uniref:hypothetical protein n=1 Tax=Winogradskyella sp. UBA3174 TaxID=1947785 RepID=UPI0025F8DA10|nr:hypothetical protein [Winogradskyella sp. UBA3174]|tara:strand:- start:135931 stop:137049 length:1119 start_codon:yes stop_codon:yes gene_type:complete